MKKNISNIIIIFLLILFAGIFFRQTIIGHKIPVPSDTLVGMYHPWLDAIAKDYPGGLPFKNFLITDPIRQQIPWRKLAVESMKNQNFAPWNPYAFSGTSLLTNIQAGMFYPFNVLFLLFSFPVAWTILIILQPILSGIFLYAYLKTSLKLSTLPSLFGALSFSYCGFSIVWLTWGTINHTILWLPLLLLLFDLLRRPYGKNQTIVISIALGLTLTFQYFAGHSQIFLYSSFLFALYAIGKLLLHKKDITGRKHIVVGICGSLLLFAGLTSVHWIPFLSYLPTTSRVAFGSAYLEEGFFIPFQHLVQFIVPDFFGNPATLNYWGIWNYAEFSGYIGITGLFFVLYSFFTKRRLLYVFWLVIVALALLFALPTPISKIPYLLHIPILSSLQPTRLLSIVDFGLCIMAAIGFEAWLDINRKKQSIVSFVIMFIVFGFLWYTVKFNPYGISKENIDVTARNIIFPTGIFIAVFAVLCLRFGLEKFLGSKKRIIGLLCGSILIGITFFDITRFGWKFTPFTDVSLFFPKTEIISYLQNQQKPFRVTALDDRIMPPNVSVYYGIESISGYDPLYDKRYETFVAAMERGEPNITPPYGFRRIITPKNITSPLFSLLGIRYVLSLSDVSDSGFQKVLQEGQTRLYENINVLPRVYLAEKITYEKDEKKIIETLYNPSYLLGKEAIVEDPLQLPSDKISDYENVEITSYLENRVDISVKTGMERLVCIGNLYQSRWKAYVDGKHTPLYRVNFLFMGVVVPDGSHTVRIQYE